jgi:signal transduction histidine kinase
MTAVNVGNKLAGFGLDRSAGLALLFIVLGVVAPAACVLWFMNQAATAQAEASRQSIAVAYRGQLAILRDKLDEYWDRRAVALDDLVHAAAASDFKSSVTNAAADSFIFRRSDGSTDYPILTTPSTQDPARDSSGVLFAQARIRGLLRNGSKAEALAVIETYFGNDGPMMRVRDAQGRLIGADERLLALRLLPLNDTRRNAIAKRLITMLNDYEHVVMPAPQRLFLMDEVRSMLPDAVFPTLNAERLASKFLEADDPRFSVAGLQATHVPDLWKLTSRNGRVVALYTTRKVKAELQLALHSEGAPKGVDILAVPPGQRVGGETMAAGTMLPGWQLALGAVDAKLAGDPARSRRVSFLWVGYCVIGAMALTGLLAGQFLRRQIRVARLKTDLVSNVSHELKTPLASMNLLLDSLIEGGEAQTAKTRDYLELIAGENQRLIRLVENFLTFSRLERRRHTFEPRDIAIAQVVESAAQIVRERFAQCDFEVEIETALPPVAADSDSLLSAVLNLLDNAFKYTGVQKRICLRAYSEPGSVVLEVEDNGTGIAAREQKKIFRRFYRVDRRLARETTGCGLGLSIVDSVARAHGGSVEVDSRIGVGSTFRLRLPRVHPARAEALRQSSGAMTA